MFRFPLGVLIFQFEGADSSEQRTRRMLQVHSILVALQYTLQRAFIQHNYPQRSGSSHCPALDTFLSLFFETPAKAGKPAHQSCTRACQPTSQAPNQFPN